MTTSTYRAGNGKQQEKYDILEQRIPAMHACPADVPKLEALRVISNLYADLYNNGGSNYTDEITKAAGVHVFVDENDMIVEDDLDMVAAALELKVDEAIALAWNEHKEVTAHSTH